MCIRFCGLSVIDKLSQYETKTVIVLSRLGLLRFGLVFQLWIFVPTSVAIRFYGSVLVRFFGFSVIDKLSPYKIETVMVWSWFGSIRFFGYGYFCPSLYMMMILMTTSSCNVHLVANINYFYRTKPKPYHYLF